MTAALINSLFELDEEEEEREEMEQHHDSIPLNESPSTDVTSCKELPRLMCSHNSMTRSSFINDGLVRSGVLLCLLNSSDPFPDFFTDHVTTMFGHMTITCQILRQNITQFFMSFRKHLYIITSSIATDDKLTSFNYCVSFLHYINSHVQRLCSAPPTNLGSLIDDVITQLTNGIQALESHDLILSSNPSNHSQHIVLHLYWTKISILLQASVAIGDKFISSLLETSIQTIKLLLTGASASFNKSSLKNKNIPQFYPCPCYLEVWLLVAKVTDCVASGNNTPAFWDLLDKVLCNEVSSSSPVGEYSVSFTWWIISCVTSIYGYTDEGVWLGDQFTCNGSWKMIQSLLMKTLRENTELEFTLRWALMCCLYLYSHWLSLPPSIIIILWEYYHRQLSKSFNQSDLDVTLSQDCTPNQWVDFIKRSCDCHMTELTFVQGNSFELFLKLLACCLREDQNGAQLWRQLKSRVYSKFSQKRVMEMNAAGLVNMISLFLMLNYVIGGSEVGQQFYTILNYRKLSSFQETNLPSLWKGLFSLLLTYHVKRTSFSSSFGNKLKSHLQPLSNDVSNLDDEGRYVTMVTILEGLEMLVDEQCTDVQCLISPLFHDVIMTSSSCGRLLSRLLQCILNISRSIDDQLDQLSGTSSATSINDTANPSLVHGIKDVLRSLWNDVSSAVSARISDSSLLQSPMLPEAAGALTHTASRWLNISCQILIDSLGLADNINPNVSVIFLTQLIQNNKPVNLLSNEENQLKLCHSLLRVTLHPSTRHELLQPFTINVSDLHFIRSLLHDAGSEDVLFSEPIALFHQLFKTIGYHYNSTVDNRVMWKHKLSIIIMNLHQYIDQLISNSTPNKLKLCYRLSAAVVRHCSKLIYTKHDAMCLLPQLLDRLVLPVGSSRRPLPQGMSSLITSHLHHFLHGLYNMDRDEFLNRKLNQIFSSHFHNSLKEHSNPFMLIIRGSFTNNPSPAALDVFIVTIKIIVRELMSPKSQPNSLIQVLQFLYQSLMHVQSYKVLLQATPILLDQLLSCLLLSYTAGTASRSPSISQLTDRILKILLVASNSHQDELPCSVLLSIIREYLLRNVGDHKELVLKPLVSMATHHLPLVQGSIPLIKQLIKDYEMKRGCGHDQLLRESLNELEKKISLETIKH